MALLGAQGRRWDWIRIFQTVGGNSEAGSEISSGGKTSIRKRNRDSVEPYGVRMNCLVNFYVSCFNVWAHIGL